MRRMSPKHKRRALVNCEIAAQLILGLKSPKCELRMHYSAKDKPLPDLKPMALPKLKRLLERAAVAAFMQRRAGFHAEALRDGLKLLGRKNVLVSIQK